jgi:hypothetical protein
MASALASDARELANRCSVMVRIGLALYLMTSVALGPALCCCLPGELLQLCASTKHLSCGPHRCCGLGVCDEQTAQSKESRGNASPVPRKDCPCKGGVTEPTLFTASQETPGAEAARCPSLPHRMGSGWSVLVDSSLALATRDRTLPEHTPFPLHTAGALLSVLQVLRC